ncbi:thiaminase II [Anaerotignum lactatifermentans]|uniref:Aminopyrimidine aminohydrolase n=1 Tax=Anaerotignum lactatifermentans TaxID=160404 RepID=A0ABS2GAG0_9FIRM|nr:thiaminase II [Anaerotignum lactatifermentans]MBM6829968.1 thiaminase II [Anaerotignum lactatifermentans]MBM6878471.1 thiaminase II [Anaerotignum lactatifermentans]MBM6951607.1 thiaminase II [Anaerotignum lactatifermentans]
MKLTQRLYESVKEIWQGYLEQPFVKELAEGTLDPAKFRFYMIQDYRYLLQYAKVFALGVAKAEDEELMRRFACMVHDVLDGEMKVHKSYMARLGITEEEVAATKTALDNQSYTSYMLDEAYKGGCLEILMSVLACAWSYQVIGEHHATIPGALEHPLYGEWVQGYCSAEYRASTQEIIDCVDALGADITPEREAALTEIFVNCSRYETKFWDMAYAMEM